MANFCQLIIVGNLTRDTEVRYLPNGTAVGQGGVAVNRKWKDSQSNEMREEVLFIDYKIWAQSAETFAQYTRKGHNVMLIGRLKLEQWEDKTTRQQRSKHIMQVEQFQFLNNTPRGEGEADTDADGNLPPPQGSRAGGYQPRQEPAPRVRHDTQSPPIPPEDDDVPFNTIFTGPVETTTRFKAWFQKMRRRVFATN